NLVSHYVVRIGSVVDVGQTAFHRHASGLSAPVGRGNSDPPGAAGSPRGELPERSGPASSGLVPGWTKHQPEAVARGALHYRFGLVRKSFRQARRGASAPPGTGRPP